jgi:hypothetical protein
MSVIPATQEEKMGRIAVPSQPGQKVSKTLPPPPISTNKPSWLSLAVISAIQVGKAQNLALGGKKKAQDTI